jgi:hypothetical protein
MATSLPTPRLPNESFHLWAKRVHKRLNELSGENCIYPRSAVLIEKSRQLIRKYEGILGFKELATTFRGCLKSYILEVPETIKAPDWQRFLSAVHPESLRILQLAVEEHRQFKFQFYLHCRFYRERDPVEKIEPYFPTWMKPVLNSSELEPTLDLQREDLGRRIEEFIQRGSGWVFERVLSLEVNVARYRALRGDGYVDLPPCLKQKQAMINVQNQDNECFKWAVLSALHPVQVHPERISHYRPFEDELNFTGIKFPVELSDIAKFERKNNLAIFVYHLANGKDVQPLHRSKLQVGWERRVRLFLHRDHYMWIKDMPRLLYDQNNHKERKHFCDFCCCSFNSEDNRDEHESRCSQFDMPQKVKMPQATPVKTEAGEVEMKPPVLQFRGRQKMEKAPFIIIADFEAQNIKEKDGASLPASTSKTTFNTRHEPCSFSCAVIRSDGKMTSYRLYRGKDTAAVSIQILKEEAENIKEALKNIMPMRLTSNDYRAFHNAQKCHICELAFDVKPDKPGTWKVRDHDHITGEFRGAAHSCCNINLRISPKIPVIFHNLRGYDSHLIMQGLENSDDIQVIANNIEKYMAIFIGKNLVLKDSLQFLNGSLDKLVKTLEPADFVHTRERFPDPAKFQLMLRKGVFPYSYLDGWEKHDETEPPLHEVFVNDLTGENISQEDYQHFLRVWREFNIKTLGEYLDLYLELDVLLLADVFENFRNGMLATHHLDPAHYFTSPHMSFDALLLNCKSSGQPPIELLTDLDMHIFFEQGMRGGIAVASHRYSKANPKYFYVGGKRVPNPNFDPSSPSKYIVYLDANNLYGWAMMQLLPVSNFRWWAPEELTQLTEEMIRGWDPKGSKGYALEISSRFPLHLHDHLSDYPLAPENIKVTESMLSPFQLDLAAENKEKAVGGRKLAPNLLEKRHYICHYRNLQFYLQQGMELVEVHRVLEFDQRAWMKEYIEKNTSLRQQTLHKFKQELYKLLNNSVFGKTMENVRKRKDIKFPNTEKEVRKLTASPRFHSQRIFKDEKLAAIEMIKTSVTLNKPVYTGFAVLELSKLLMFQFWYECMKPLYGEKIKLLYTDTDSLIMEVETEDFYQDMKENGDWFDTSDYPKDHPCYSDANKKVPGKMKDELNGELALEFVGVRAKMYSVLTESAVKKKAKGVSRHITEKVLAHEDYKDCVHLCGKYQHEMRQIRSKKHQIYTQSQLKTTLNPLDTKRWICKDGISTLPFGHYATAKEEHREEMEEL